ncbi:sugar kinase [Gynuella sunshinyii]|uniref:2-dehydro-3-deoxygluconokinase n=1 Tax=Gynuella sunshinyii YC6258 TaxID=1445510 RepID=A0A0C5VIP6_9GAMM|nr:sugar kinase [Gynuella sunshinyii]AJQ93213.1 sugar kinase, ribokinase family [Gynuella sunshinyii YC6258]
MQQESEKPIRLALIGECMIELRGPMFGALQQSWGGDTYNTAIYLRRMLDHHFDVHYITGLGEDQLSHFLLHAWQEEGLNVGDVTLVSGKRPGLYQISVDEDGERSFQYWRNDSAAKYIFDEQSGDVLAAQFQRFEWLYLSGISLAILTPLGRRNLLDALALYAGNGGRIVFDNNYRPLLWPSVDVCQAAYREVLSLAHLALLTADDEQVLWGHNSVEEILAHYDCEEVVIKRGSEPCVIRHQQRLVEVGAQRVENVVDTTAAGDSFAAGYWFGRLTGLSPEESARCGHRLAATVIQHPGAIIPKSFMP